MNKLKIIIDKWESLLKETLPELEAIWQQLDECETLMEASELRQYIDDHLKMGAGLEDKDRLFSHTTFLLTDIRFMLVKLEAGMPKKKVKAAPKDTLAELQKLMSKLSPTDIAKLKGL